MITECDGSIFDSNAYALVNPVNCVGVMGKGLALEFKQRFPGNFRTYQSACKQHAVQVGRVFRYDTLLTINPRVIYNFPTKQHWRDASKLKWVEDGLLDLMYHLAVSDVPSIAIPALGCGEGGLSWREVRARIGALAAAFPQISFMIYPPKEKKRERQES